LIVLGENVDIDLVADGWLAIGRWVTAIVGGLRFAGGGTGENSLGESGIVSEGEEFVTHVSVGLGRWVKRGVDCATKDSWTIETILWIWVSILVVTVRASDDNGEFP
jgi:hypothetical protein